MGHATVDMNKRNTVTGNDADILNEGGILTGKYAPQALGRGPQGRNTNPDSATTDAKGGPAQAGLLCARAGSANEGVAATRTLNQGDWSTGIPVAQETSTAAGGREAPGDEAPPAHECVADGGGLDTRLRDRGPHEEYPHGLRGVTKGADTPQPRLGGSLRGHAGSRGDPKSGELGPRGRAGGRVGRQLRGCRVHGAAVWRAVRDPTHLRLQQHCQQRLASTLHLRASAPARRRAGSRTHARSRATSSTRRESFGGSIPRPSGSSATSAVANSLPSSHPSTDLVLASDSLRRCSAPPWPARRPATSSRPRARACPSEVSSVTLKDGERVVGVLSSG